jgi:iron complex outermembrane receptor protein
LEKKYGIPPDGKSTDRVTVDMRQTKVDFKAQLNKPFAFTEQLRMKFGYTDYQHIERVNDAPETTFLNTAYESRLELEHKPIGVVKGTMGFQSTNSQFSALGDEALVPPSDIDTYSLFAVESFDSGPMSYNFGVRGEWQTISPQGQTSLTYLPISGSASALWHINDQQQITLAYTHSERAPQIQELLSKGRHEATHSYEIGNRTLSKELSNNLDLSYRFNASWMTADISLFHNWVSDYIFQQRSGEVREGLPVLNTQQGAATFKGFEAQAILPLMENTYGAIDLTLFSDYTRGTFDNGGDVPRLPPLRYGFQLSYEKADFFGNLRFTRAEAQNNPGQNDTNTQSYLLLNLQAQYRLASFHDAEVLLFAKAKNLLDENIRNSTSYLRNFAPEPGRSAEFGLRISY